jgi:hypothetical protein
VKVTVLVAAAEAAATGLILMVSPSLFGWLVLGAGLSEPGQALGRLAGIALFSFGLACWPGSEAVKQATSGIRALLIYNLLATIYLSYLGVAANLGGLLLWPAVALHVTLSILLVRAWRIAIER